MDESGGYLRGPTIHIIGGVELHHVDEPEFPGVGGSHAHRANLGKGHPQGGRGGHPGGDMGGKHIKINAEVQDVRGGGRLGDEFRGLGCGQVRQRIVGDIGDA